MGSRSLTPTKGGFERRAAVVLAFAGATAALVFCEIPLCPLASFAGIPCPGCGLTRATLAFARGDMTDALALHPLVPVIAPLALGILAAHATSYVLNGRLLSLGRKAARWSEALLLALSAAMLVIWVARFFGAFGGPVAV